MGVGLMPSGRGLRRKTGTNSGNDGDWAGWGGAAGVWGGRVSYHAGVGKELDRKGIGERGKVQEVWAGLPEQKSL